MSMFLGSLVVSTCPRTGPVGGVRDHSLGEGQILAPGGERRRETHDNTR